MQTLARWVAAGISWWIEGLWDEAEAVARQRIVQGPPTID